MRGGTWMAIAALAVFYVWLGQIGAARTRGRGFDRLLADPRFHDGTPVGGTDYAVVRLEPGGFVLERDGWRVFVHSDAPVRAGDHVEYAGTFRGDGTLQAHTVTVLHEFALKRFAMVAVSGVALTIVAAGFIRHCKPRFSTGLIREAPCPTP